MAATTCSPSGRTQLPAALVLAKLKPLLEDPAVLKIGHNFKFDWIVFDRRGISVAPYDDTLVMSFNLDAGGLNSHALDDLAKKHLDHDCIAFKELCGTGQKQITFDQVPLDRATEYAAEDADVTLRLWQRFQTRLPLEKVTRVYEMVDRPLVAVVGADGARGRQGRPRGAERACRPSSTPRSPRWRRRSAARPAASSPSAAPAARRHPVQPDGPEGRPQGQVRRLFDRRQNELERLAREGVPIARLVLEWRQLTKLKSTYTDALQEQINHETGRVHTSYSLSGAQTGRLSSTDPNLQNIPIRTEIGRRIRDAFVAEPGYRDAGRRLQPDRTAPRRPYVRRAAAQGRLRGGRGHPQPAPRRNCSARSIATRAAAPRRSTSRSSTASRAGAWPQRLAITPDEAQAMIDRYFERFPGIRDYIGDTLTHVRETGFTTTLFGRKTHFPRHQVQRPARAPGRRARRDQRADPGHQRRHHQAGDGARWARRSPPRG